MGQISCKGIVLFITEFYPVLTIEKCQMCIFPVKRVCCNVRMEIGAGVTESGAKVTPFSSVSERYSARSLHSLSYCFASPLIREYVALTESGILENRHRRFLPPTLCIGLRRKLQNNSAGHNKYKTFVLHLKNLANLQRTRESPYFYLYIQACIPD